MKKSGILLFLAAATVMASCQKSEVNEVLPSGDSVISAVIDNGNTRTTLDGVKVCWVSGDAIAVNKAKYLATPDANDARCATFTLTSTNPIKPATPPTDAPFCAYYPYDANRTTSKGEFILPSTQNYSTSNTLGMVNPMYAVSESLEDTFHFKNVCGLLTLDLKGEGYVKDITISAKEFLAGILTNVAISDKGELTYNAIEDDGYYASKSVSLGCGSKATLNEETARRFYIALPEGDFTDVLLTVTTDKGKFEFPATKTVSIKKNNIYHLPEMTVKAEPLEFDAQIAVVKNEATVVSLDFAISVTPTDKDVYYLVDIATPSYTESFENAYELAKGDISYWSEYNTFSELVSGGIIVKGDCAEFEPSFDLDQDKDYVAYAYAVDEYFNVSPAIKLNVHTAKGELPEYNAQYSDYLGEWTMGADVITVAELESGKTYKVTGISNLTNSLCTIPYVTASFEKGNFVLNEQYTGQRAPVSDYGDCDFFLSGINSLSLPNYPFYTDNPSILLYGQFSNDEINVYASSSNLGITWRILSGEDAGNGNFLTPTTTIPSVMKHPAVADPEYSALLGTYTFNALDYFNETGVSGTLVVEKDVVNESFRISIPGIGWCPESGRYIDHFICPWDKSGKKSFSLIQGAKGDQGLSWNYGSLGVCGIQLDFFYWGLLDDIDAVVLTADENGNLHATAPAVPDGDYLCLQSLLYNGTGALQFANGLLVFVNGMDFIKQGVTAVNNVQHSVSGMPANLKDSNKLVPAYTKTATKNTKANVVVGTHEGRMTRRIAR